MSTLPKDWQLTPLGNILKQVTNPVKLEIDKKYTFAGVKWYGEGIFERESLLGSEVAASKAYKVSPKALIYNRLFAWKESFALTPDHTGELFVSNEFPQFEIKLEKCIPEFVLLACLSRPFIQMVNRLSSGSAAVSRNRLKESEFLDLSIPLPPLSIQERIVERWRVAVAQTKALEAQATLSETQVQTEFLTGLGLQAPQTQVRKRAFATYWSNTGRWGVSGIGVQIFGIQFEKSKYPLTRIEDLATDMRYGTSDKASISGKGFPVIRMSNLKDGLLDLTDLKYIDIPRSDAERYKVRYGDILINRTNSKELVGKTAVFRESKEYIYASYLIAFGVDQSRALPDYVSMCLNSPLGRQQIDAVSRQIIGQANINSEEIRELRIPLPPLSIQHELVEGVNAAYQAAAQMRRQATEMLKQARISLEEAILGRDQSILEEE